jgi:hypothetical protein
VGAERRRRTVIVEGVSAEAVGDRRDGGRRRDAPSPLPAAVARSGRTRRAHLTLVVLVAGMILVLAGSGFAAVQVVGRAGPIVETLFPPETVVISPDVFAEVAAPPPTTAPPPELAVLRGRPPSPVDADEATCAVPLKAGKLRPQAIGTWQGTSPPATGSLSDADARAEITQMMRRRFRRDDPERAVREAIQLYESPRVREVAGEQIMVRAALAELKGTLGEPALRFVFSTDRPVKIIFGQTQNPRAGAEANSYGFAIDIVVRDMFRSEPPAVLAPILMHELLHQNGQAQQPEEIVNSVLDVRVLLEMIRDAPAVFTRRSAGVDLVRVRALAQLNTRVGSVLAVNRSDVQDVLPGFEDGPVPPFGQWLVQDDDPNQPMMYSNLADAPTKGHPALVEILQQVAPEVTVPERAQFNQAAVDLLDTHAGIGLCDQLVAAEAIGALPRGSAGQRVARDYLANLTK